MCNIQRSDDLLVRAKRYETGRGLWHVPPGERGKPLGREDTWRPVNLFFSFLFFSIFSRVFDSPWFLTCFFGLGRGWFSTVIALRSLDLDEVDIHSMYSAQYRMMVSRVVHAPGPWLGLPNSSSPTIWGKVPPSKAYCLRLFPPCKSSAKPGGRGVQPSTRYAGGFYKGWAPLGSRVIFVCEVWSCQ